jgi:hypothetical protein
VNAGSPDETGRVFPRQPGQAEHQPIDQRDVDGSGTRLEMQDLVRRRAEAVDLSKR